MAKVITVYGPKGGVGKTTIALALARTLAHAHKVVVLEVDFTPGDVAATLEVDLKELSLTQEGDTASSIQRPPRETFDVLTGGFPDVAEAASHEAVFSIIADLREGYDYVIIDTQSYLTEGVVAALRAADRLLLVTEDSIPSISRTVGMMDYLVGNAFADMSRAKLVINRMSTSAGKYIGTAVFFAPIACRIPELGRFAGHRDARIVKVMETLVKGGVLD